jgi:hypothetical protein
MPYQGGLLLHRCIGTGCCVCEWIAEQRHTKLTPTKDVVPVKQVHMSWPVPMRGLTALSMLGANVVTLK